MYLLQPQDDSASLQRFFTPESAILYALLEAYLEQVQFATVGLITTLANQKLASEGERLRLHPRKVGPILRKHGFKTEKCNAGIGFWVTKEVVKMITNLSRHHGILVPPEVNGTETHKGDAAEEMPGKKPSNTAAVDMPPEGRARKGKKRA